VSGTDADSGSTAKPAGASPLIVAATQLSAIVGNLGGQGRTSSRVQRCESSTRCNNAPATSGATDLGRFREHDISQNSFGGSPHTGQSVLLPNSCLTKKLDGPRVLEIHHLNEENDYWSHKANSMHRSAYRV